MTEGGAFTPRASVPPSLLLPVSSVLLPVYLHGSTYRTLCGNNRQTIASLEMGSQRCSSLRPGTPTWPSCDLVSSPTLQSACGKDLRPLGIFCRGLAGKELLASGRDRGNSREAGHGGAHSPTSGVGVGAPPGEGAEDGCCY